jgi:tape measure domain-containing protein
VAQSTVRLIVDAQNAIRPLQRVNEQTKALSSSTNKLKGKLDKSNRSLRDTGKSARVASTGVKGLVGALKPLLAALAVVGTARFVFVKTAELETQRKSLEVLTGSLEKTNKIIKELQDFGSVTPFTSSELIEQSKRLKAFGFETDELADSVKRLSDIAGATGADLSGIATAFGQIRAKGKLQQEENLQLLERGVDITTELKRITGLQGEEFESAMRKGKIGADLVNQAFLNLTDEGGAFFGGATAQANTLNGKLSTLVDSVETLARTVGDELGDEIKMILDLGIEAVGQITKLVESIGLVSKLGKKDMIKIETEARDFATEEISKEFGFFERRFNKDARKQFQEIMNLKKKELITNALNLKELEKQKIETEKITENLNGSSKNADKLNKNLKKTEQPIATLENKTNATTTAIESNIAITDLFNTSLGETSFLMDEISFGSDNIADSLFNVKTEADELKEKFMEIGQGIESGIVSGLTDAVMGTKSLAEAASGVLNNLKRQLIELAMQRTVSGIGNFFGNALSGMFGGGGGLSISKSIGLGASLGSSNFSKFSFLSSTKVPKFADGGYPPMGKASLVGERGPELFVPSRAGTIIPNNKLGGGDSVTNVITVNVDANSSNVTGNNADANQLGNQIAVAIQSELIKQKRAGGLLA